MYRRSNTPGTSDTSHLFPRILRSASYTFHCPCSLSALDCTVSHTSFHRPRSHGILYSPLALKVNSCVDTFRIPILHIKPLCNLLFTVILAYITVHKMARR